MRQNEVNCCCGKWLQEFWRIRRSCKTKPISRGGSRPRGRGAIVQNKPNFGELADGEIPTIPLFYYSTIPTRCRLCETKPIPGGAGRDGTTGAWDAGQMCETKPILAAPAVGTSHHSRIPSFHHSHSGHAAWDGGAASQAGVLRWQMISSITQATI